MMHLNEKDVPTGSLGLEQESAVDKSLSIETGRILGHGHEITVDKSLPIETGKISEFLLWTKLYKTAAAVRMILGGMSLTATPRGNVI